MSTRIQKWRRLGAIIALTGVMLRALVADGFMLTGTGDGLALAPCPVRSPALAQLAKKHSHQHHAHHHHHHQGGGDDGGDASAAPGSCPYAVASAPAVPPAAISISLDAVAPPPVAQHRFASLSRTNHLRPPATGPPVQLS
jgi:hypothetical protein